jgi:hypothetical protein
MGNSAYKDLARLVRGVCARPRVWRGSCGGVTGPDGRPDVGVGESTYVSFVAGALQDEFGEDGCAR